MIFDDLEKLYNEIDNYYSIKEFNARSNNLETEEFEAMLQREHNDQAYYLYMFSRLERRLQDLLDNLIKTKSSSVTDTKDKNSWRIIKQKRLELMEKVSFFAQPGGTDYNLIYNYKDKRDDVAHGKYAKGINISEALTDMKRLYTALDN